MLVQSGTLGLSRFSHIVSTLAILKISVVPLRADAKWVRGQSSISAKQARVVTKFCFDFSSECGGDKQQCPEELTPGVMDFNLSVTKPYDFGTSAPRLYVALLDDEYFSFPEVSQVWGEANCTDVVKASKTALQLDWPQLKKPGGQHLHVPLVEKVRPRWWYIALVSCSNHDVEIAYSMHLSNRRKGWQSEFSMDSMGVLAMTAFFSLIFGVLLIVQLKSARAWQTLSRLGPQWVRTHPALQLLTAATCLSLVSSACWLHNYWHFMKLGESNDISANLARLGANAAKTVMQIILLLLAQGQCVCTPDLVWSDHTQLFIGNSVFGMLSLGLEIWGDSEFWSTTTEFVYDTRPGCILVAFDIYWFYSYASKSYETFSKETAVKPRRFYKGYGLLFGIWFATLPALAALARAVSPWVRFRVVFACSVLAHAVALSVLVHTFRPAVAVELYSLKMHEYEAVNQEELGGL
eukprot:CAMPEP_0172872234 /NCGR_PEP_ID=MMETSP1075-20121228/92521_1 /TAXON_ID=2916 /ORGANISM="Ceratium fusus, Strain PA161109" /LENGTH=464 /DNA_ID=CAMNT_0013722547 /DNA_START=35 /DNA_END=1426 /DNA_ORIENTATION=-